MDKKIQTSLEQLLQDLKGSDIYKNFKKEEKEWENAKESQELLKKFIEARSTLDIFQHGDFDGLTEQRKKVSELYKEVEKDKNIKNWENAQRDYQKFTQELVNYLSKELGFSIAPPQEGGCCG